jgi:hypothetical protein
MLDGQAQIPAVPEGDGVQHQSEYTQLILLSCPVGLTQLPAVPRTRRGPGCAWRSAISIGYKPESLHNDFPPIIPSLRIIERMNKYILHMHILGELRVEVHAELAEYRRRRVLTER